MAILNNQTDFIKHKLRTIFTVRDGNYFIFYIIIVF